MRMKPIGRNSGVPRPLRQLAPLGTRQSRPWWWLIPLLIIGLLLPLAWTAWRHWSPATLSEGHLAGQRSPAPVSVVLLLDVSGSFTDYQQMRETALREVVDWMPRNLRPDDRITVIDFAADACVVLPTTRVGDLGAIGAQFSACPVDGSSTLIQPALERSIQATSGEATSLVAVTDTLVADAAADTISDQVARLGAGTMSVIIPSGLAVDRAWGASFPWEVEYQADPGNASYTALAVGRALAHATGQELRG